MEEREEIVSRVLSCVKECQIRFGVRTELATELDDRVVRLCSALECALTHGLKTNTNILEITKNMVINGLPRSSSTNTPFDRSNARICLWQFVSLHLTKHELDRYYILRNVHTDMGRSRSWLRSALNEHSLERYVLMFLQDITLRTQFYEQWSLLRDEDNNAVLPTIARGLSSILFAINIDNPEFDNSSDKHNQTNGIEIKHSNEPQPVFVASSANSNSYLNRRRPKKVNVISLSDEESDNDSNDTSFYARSAPSTCLSSPNLVLDSNRIQHTNHTNNDLSDSRAVQTENYTLKQQLLTPYGTSLVLAIEDNISDSDKLSNSESYDIENDQSYQKESNKTEGSLQSMANANQELETIRIEMQCLKTKYDEQIAKLEAQNDAQIKENDILKIQLKKYIAAVQLLKFGQKRDVEDLSSDKLENYDQHLDYSPSFLYYNEINEYEKKLVQVAEMHGELVEFNDHLHRIINQKEAIIRRLREELVDLRGPLPECNQSPDDNFSILSDFDSSLSLQTAISYPLINIWIPTAFLSGGQKNKSHHVYQIYIRIKDEEWNIYRRYSQFHSLHKSLRKKFPILSTFDFPPKKTIGYKDSKVVQERRKRLECYLRNLTNLLQSQHQDINDKESLISLLPFLSERMIQREGHSHSDTHLNLPNTSNSILEHHYMGL